MEMIIKSSPQNAKVFDSKRTFSLLHEVINLVNGSLLLFAHDNHIFYKYFHCAFVNFCKRKRQSELFVVRILNSYMCYFNLTLSERKI